MKAPLRQGQLQHSTTAGCGLAIGRYPRFSYDARGGGGIGELGEPRGSGPRSVRFEPSNLEIPPLNGRTTRVLGVPLPPGLTIAISPDELAGSVEPATGWMELRFRARFRFSVTGLYQAPDLQIDTLLSTGPVRGRRHRGTGQAVGPDGQALLVGVAMVPPCGEAWLDRFLGLPDEALAMLRCSFAPPL